MSIFPHLAVLGLAAALSSPIHQHQIDFRTTSPDGIERINQLANKVRAQSGKVIFIQHCGRKGDDFEPQTPGWAFLPDLFQDPADIIIRKDLSDPFAGTLLQARLQEIAPDRLLITGWATDLCVDATVRSAVSNHHKRRGGRRRPYAERPPSFGRSQRHSSSQLGLEQPYHTTVR